MKPMNVVRKYGSKFGRQALVAGFLLGAASSAFAVDPTSITELAAAAGTELAPVKLALLAIGGILLGIAALLYGIYKVVSMASGRK